MNHDKLYNQPATSVASAAIQTIDGIQSMPPELQVLGVISTLRAMRRVLKLDVGQLLHTVERMERDCRYRSENTLTAVDAYVRGELQ